MGLHTRTLMVTGSAQISGSLDVGGALTIPDYIYHAGDVDTFVQLGSNIFTFAWLLLL